MQNTYSVLQMVYLVIHLVKVEKSISKFENEQMSKLIWQMNEQMGRTYEFT